MNTNRIRQEYNKEKEREEIRENLKGKKDFNNFNDNGKIKINIEDTFVNESFEFEGDFTLGIMLKEEDNKRLSKFFIQGNASIDTIALLVGELINKVKEVIKERQIEIATIDILKHILGNYEEK